MGRLSLVLVTLLTLCVVTTDAPAKSKVASTPVVFGELGRKIEAAVDKAGGPGFWGAVLVAKDGDILLAKGYGTSSNMVGANTPLTLFELASASKQITGAAILHLQQKRKLKTSDSIARFFGKHFKRMADEKKAITVHHLLTHTSGLAGDLGVPYASPIRRSAYIQKMLAKPLVAKPGEKFAYSNVGYALLAAIVEEVTGKTFEEYCERNLFKPAKMANTGFINDRDLIKTGRASTRRSKEPGAWTAAKWHWGWGYKGMGGVVTTVYDMHRWDQALRGDKILNEDSKAVLFTPYKAGYACGWKVNTTPRGTRKAHHSGGVAGYRTNVVHYIEEDCSITVLSNDENNPFAITTAVEELLFPAPKIAVTINVKPYKMGQPPILKLPAEKLAWKATANPKSFRLMLRQGRHTILEITTPRGYASMLSDSLAQAISAREADDDGSEARTEATLYLQPYAQLFPKFTLTQKLTMDINPQYRHSGGVDKRVMVVLMDAQYGQWPAIALLNVAAAKELQREILATFK